MMKQIVNTTSWHYQLVQNFFSTTLSNHKLAVYYMQDPEPCEWDKEFSAKHMISSCKYLNMVMWSLALTTMLLAFTMLTSYYATTYLVMAGICINEGASVHFFLTSIGDADIGIHPSWIDPRSIVQYFTELGYKPLAVVPLLLVLAAMLGAGLLYIIGLALVMVFTSMYLKDRADALWAIYRRRRFEAKRQHEEQHPRAQLPEVDDSKWTVWKAIKAWHSKICRPMTFE